MPRSAARSSSSSVIGVAARSSAHAARSKSRYADSGLRVATLIEFTGTGRNCGLLLEVVGVLLDVTLPLVRHFVERVDGFHRTGRDAGAAIDALIGMDV